LARGPVLLIFGAMKNYRQTRETIHATPAHNVALKAIDRTNPEIAAQFVGRPSDSESFSHHVCRKP
jgi:hypothetical protein